MGTVPWDFGVGGWGGGKGFLPKSDRRRGEKKWDFVDVTLRSPLWAWMRVEGMELDMDPKKTLLGRQEGMEDAVGTMPRVGEEP